MVKKGPITIHVQQTGSCYTLMSPLADELRKEIATAPLFVPEDKQTHKKGRVQLMNESARRERAVVAREFAKKPKGKPTEQ